MENKLKRQIGEHELTVEYDEAAQRLFIFFDSGSSRGLAAVLLVNDGRPSAYIDTVAKGDGVICIAAVNNTLVVTPGADVMVDDSRNEGYINDVLEDDDVDSPELIIFGIVWFFLCLIIPFLV